MQSFEVRLLVTQTLGVMPMLHTYMHPWNTDMSDKLCYKSSCIKRYYEYSLW